MQNTIMTIIEQEEFFKWLWPGRCFIKHKLDEDGQCVCGSLEKSFSLARHIREENNKFPNLTDPGDKDFLDMMEAAAKKGIQKIEFYTVDKGWACYLFMYTSALRKCRYALGNTAPFAFLTALNEFRKG